ncbi:MAG: fimbrillin family protein [Bacteroidales bacterium]|nr:fimbrillin family protein [Bacteroidales bacterium]
MKRFFFLAVAATCLLASCNKTEIVPTGELQEISFVAVNKVATKAPVDDATFLTGDDMDVAAYLAAGDGATAGTFFTETKFTYASATETWTGKRYWPLSDATINFLAVTNIGGGVTGHVENTFNAGNPASEVVSVLTGNNDASQTDLMFAAGQGTHVQGAAYTNVGMVFKHALSWVNFQVKTGNGLTDADPKIVINSITLNNAAVNGTLTVTNANYAATSNTCVTNNLTTDWSSVSYSNMKLIETGIVTDDATDALLLTDEFAEFGGNGILVVPSDQTSFTINYTVTQPDGTPNTFNYTYNLAGNKWDMAQKYVYHITMTLSEIQIEPSITSWGEPISSYPSLDGQGNEEVKP